MSSTRQWQGVSLEAEKGWRQIFNASIDGINVKGNCPVCQSLNLHHWFDRARPFSPGKERAGFVGHGGGWEWCSSCFSYEHFSGLVPDWWRDSLVVDYAVLTATPEAIEAARLRQSQ